MVNRLKLTFGALALLGVSANGGVAQEFVDVELTRLDGSTMTRNYEKPRYGGTITMNREILLVSFSNWDPKGGGGPHELANVQITNQRLSQLDWARGASGTNDYPNFVCWQHHRSTQPVSWPRAGRIPTTPRWCSRCAKASTSGKKRTWRRRTQGLRLTMGVS